MRAQIHTIPVIDAFNAGDECPFCNLERSLERHTIDYTIGGSSYMEKDIRDITDAKGFCRDHAKKLYQYGNPLGNALMLQTYYDKLQTQLKKKMDEHKPEKRSIGDAIRKQKKEEDRSELVTWAYSRQHSCFICERVQENFDRHMETFFTLCKDSEFRTLVENCKGFCFHHFTIMMDKAQALLPNSCMDWFYPAVFKAMSENMDRVYEDLMWLIQKSDYRFQDAPWKNSRDALQRAVQKIYGIYPADPPHKEKK